MKRLATIALCIALAACSKKKDDGGAGMASGSAATVPASGSAGSATTPDVGSGSAGSATAAAGSGSAAAAGSGSAAAGSGSAMAAGSGSDAAGSAAGSGSAVAAGSGAGSGSAAPAEEKSAFDKLTGEEKAEFMKTKVVPPMKAAFQKFDGKKYANFGCKTCHGKDPKATKFKMPNPELPKLDFAALEAGKQKPEIAKWMGMVVKPEMAKILGQKEFDPKHPEMGGFGCLECHEQKK
jgi:hypothetical protein